MQKMHRLLSILILFIGSSSLAFDECSEVRMDSPGGSMERITTREQVGGTCFFEVATQLFDAYRAD